MSGNYVNDLATSDDEASEAATELEAEGAEDTRLAGVIINDLND